MKHPAPLYAHEVAIQVLAGDFSYSEVRGLELPDPLNLFPTKVDALAFLRDLTKKDFDRDIALWREWFTTCSEEMPLYKDLADSHRWGTD